MEISFALGLEQRLSDLEAELHRIEAAGSPSSERDSLKSTIEDIRKLIRRWVS